MTFGVMPNSSCVSQGNTRQFGLGESSSLSEDTLGFFQDTPSFITLEMTEAFCNRLFPP